MLIRIILPGPTPEAIELPPRIKLLNFFLCHPSRFWTRGDRILGRRLVLTEKDVMNFSSCYFSALSQWKKQ